MMLKNLPRLLLTASFAFLFTATSAARVDSLDIASAGMKKTYKAAVVIPAGYEKNKDTYPVLYLLHGGFGHYRDWIDKTTDKNLLHRLADQYNIIIVLPEGEVFSYYIDSPVDKGSQFESYIIKDVIVKIDNTYRTNRSSKGRAISGLSMGGYGALYLSARHPDMFGAAGSMSGALNPDMLAWKLPPEMAANIKKAFAAIMGPIESVDYSLYSVVNMTETIKKNGTKLIFDCGVDDFLIEPNREMHRRLVFNQMPHEYSERPGGHSWEYWEKSLPHHILFFSDVFKANKTNVQLN